MLSDKVELGCFALQTHKAADTKRYSKVVNFILFRTGSSLLQLELSASQARSREKREIKRRKRRVNYGKANHEGRMRPS
jgi:hypothetical protein